MVPNNISLLVTSCPSTLKNELRSEFNLIDYTLTTYQNGEVNFYLKNSLENQNIFLIHFIEGSLHDSLMVLLLMIHAAKGQKANQINVILPCLPYNRQSHSQSGPSPISLMAQLLEAAGATGLTTIDLHDPLSMDFFKIPVHHLSFMSTIASDIKNRDLSNYVIVSPDKGGISRAKDLADHLQVPLISLDKKRFGPGNSQVLGLNGDARGKLCLIFDDIIDSGNTLLKATERLLEEGARGCEAYITHSFLTPDTAKRIATSKLDRLTLSDTCAPLASSPDKIYTLSLTANIIQSIKNTMTIR